MTYSSHFDGVFNDLEYAVRAENRQKSLMVGFWVFLLEFVHYL